MASDMLVALGRATPDGQTLFAHNANRSRGGHAALGLLPAGDHAPGDTTLGVPEVRHTFAALVAHAADEAANSPYCGVNEKGVAVGHTAIATRLLGEGPALSGPDLVRLALQRAASARQAVEVVTDLVTRHGQGGGSCARSLDSALLLADAREAYVLEAAGGYWALAQVGSVRAVAPACMLRRDWDRLSRGLSDLAISRGWWPGDGCKIDFAGAVGRIGPDHAETLHRWGRATMTLEHNSGHLDVPLFRRALRDQAELVAPADAPAGERRTVSSFVARLGPDELPVCWCAFGTPALSVFLPVLLCGDLPEAYGGRLARDLASLADDARSRPRAVGELRAALAELQGRLDDHAHDFLAEAHALHRDGAGGQLRRLAGSFMHYVVERADDLIDAHRPRPTHAAREEVMMGAEF